MAQLKWDKTGEHYFETGVDHGVLYVIDDTAQEDNDYGKYGTGVVWNGLTTVSENLSDIYQELKNFVMAYKNANNEELMMNALADVKEEFQFSWGQKLVNVQRALHEVRYSEEEVY